MSIVVAVMKKDSVTMAGDTQLNDENGAIRDLGLKVFPCGSNVLIGMTGEYRSYINAANILMNSRNLRNKGIEAIAEDIKRIIEGKKNNVVIAQLTSKETRFVVMGNEYGYDCLVESVANPESAAVKVLLPPGLTAEFCMPYITSLDNLKNQISRCIAAVSTVSDTVNNKVCGFEMCSKGIRLFCKNVKYEDINVRINLESIK